jgi:hypothetical protein
MDQAPVPMAGIIKRRLITDDLWECFIDDASICPYALIFSNSFFCRQTSCRMPEKQNCEEAP